MNINENPGPTLRPSTPVKKYLQAVKEVLLSVGRVYNQHPEFEAKIIERMVEPTVSSLSVCPGRILTTRVRF